MRKTFLARRVLAVLLALTMAASLIPAALAADESITLDRQTLALKMGETETGTLKATMLVGVIEGDLVWTSDDDTVASVSGDGTVTGTVTAKKAGTATITVKDNNSSAQATCAVTVSAADIVPTLTLTPKTAVLGSLGAAVTLTATVTGDPSAKVTWKNGNDEALRVTHTGSSSITLTALAVSADTPVDVSATYVGSDGTEQTEICTITVKKNTEPGNMLVSVRGEMKPAELSLKTGAQETVTFALTKTTGDGGTFPISSNDGNASYSWSTSNNSVVRVVKNRNTNTATLTAVNPGSTRVTVTATYTQNGITRTSNVGECAVTVSQRVGTIRITPTGPFTMEPNGTQVLNATTEPANQTITWTVPAEDQKVATVQAGGSGSTATIYAHSPGKTSVTATIGTEGNTESQNVVVEVSGIILKDENDQPLGNTVISLTENERKMVPLIDRFGNANNGKQPSWQSMDISVAEVSGNSVVGRGPGKTTITAFCGAYTASFTVQVGAGQSTIDLTGSAPLRSGDSLAFSSLISRISQQVEGGLSHVTNLSVSTSQGTLYYKYISDAQNGEGVAMSENYYAQGGYGRKTLADVTFIPKPGYSGPVTITYNAISSTGAVTACRILHKVEQGTTSAFTLSTPYNTALNFNSTEFETVCRAATGAQLDYVTFSLPPVRQGSLYTNYVSAGNFGRAVTTQDKFSRRELGDVWFVPAPGFAGDVTVYYTGHSTGKPSKTYSGQVRVTVLPEDGVAIGGLSYDVVKGGVARFDDIDFGDYCREVLDRGQSLSYITFDSLPASDRGVLYYDYRSSANTGSRVSAGTAYYYGTRTPRIDWLTFVPQSDFTGTIRLPFTGMTTGGTRFAGNVEINVRGSSTGTGNIYYTCQPGKSVSLRAGDFNQLCRERVNDRLYSIQFQGLPNSGDGTLYYSTSAASANRTYYYGSSYPRIENLSFRANSRFSGSVDIPFIGTADSGETFSGIVTIDSKSVASSGNDLHYYADSKTPAVFARRDFDDLSQWLTERDVNTVKFTLPPSSQGTLYQNYTSASNRGSAIASSSTSISGSSLGRVAFIPASGFLGTVSIPFTARATNNEEFTGTVEITVEQAAADVTVRYSTQVTPVHFRGNDFARGGYTLRSVRFGAMPASSAGHLYFQYHSPTNYDRQASTGSTYNLTGSNLISDLTFVPKAGYSGTVTLPYVGTNSNNSTFEGEVVITVSPAYSSAYFNDMSSYTNEQRAAVDYLYEANVTTGVGSGRYGPTSSITRGDFALMVYKAFGMTPSGSNQFSDIAPSDYYAQAVNTLYARGIVSGVGNGRYGPNSQVTRQDALIMVRQAMRSVGWSAFDGFSSTLDGYSDGGSVAQYAQGAVSFALQMGYLPTNGSYIDPRANLSRVDMAQILHRVLTS